MSGVSINSRVNGPERDRVCEVGREKIAGGANGSGPSRETYAGGPSIAVSRSFGAKAVDTVRAVEVGGAVMLGNDTDGSGEGKPTASGRAVRMFSGMDAIRKIELRMRILYER